MGQNNTLAELKIKVSYNNQALKAGLSEDEKALKKSADMAASYIKKAEDNAKQAMSAHERALAKLPDVTRRYVQEAGTAMAAYQEKVVDHAKKIGQAMTLGITVPAALLVKKGVEIAASFEQSMDITQNVLHATAKEMAALSKEAQKLGADITLPKTSAVDAAMAMKELGKANFDVKGVLGATRGSLVLAAAAHITAAKAAEIQAGALNAFHLPAEQAGKVADLLAASANASAGEITDMADALKMSAAVFNAAHIPIEDLVTEIGLMANNAILGSDAGTSLKQMMLQLQNPSDKARAIMKELGVAVYDATGKMKSQRDIIGILETKLKPLTQETRDFALAAIFGSDAIRSSNVLINEGVAGFDKMKKRVTEQGAAAKAAEAQNKGLNGALDALQSSAESLAQQLAEPTLKPLANVVRSFADFLGVVGNLNPFLLNTTLVLVGVAAAAGPAILAGSQLFQGYKAVVDIRAAYVAAQAAKAAANAALATSGMAAAAAETTQAAAASAGAIAAGTATVAVWGLVAAYTALAALAVIPIIITVKAVYDYADAVAKYEGATNAYAGQELSAGAYVAEYIKQHKGQGNDAQLRAKAMTTATFKRLKERDDNAYDAKHGGGGDFDRGKTDSSGDFDTGPGAGADFNTGGGSPSAIEARVRAIMNKANKKGKSGGGSGRTGNSHGGLTGSLSGGNQPLDPFGDGMTISMPDGTVVDGEAIKASANALLHYEEAMKRAHTEVAKAIDPNNKFAEALGMELGEYKQLPPEAQKAAKAMAEQLIQLKGVHEEVALGRDKWAVVFETIDKGMNDQKIKFNDLFHDRWLENQMLVAKTDLEKRDLEYKKRAYDWLTPAQKTALKALEAEAAAIKFVHQWVENLANTRKKSDEAEAKRREEARDKAAKLAEEAKEKAIKNHEDLVNSAQRQAERMADILIQPFEHIHNGIAGIFQDILTGWRDMIRNMILDWARSQISAGIQKAILGNVANKTINYNNNQTNNGSGGFNFGGLLGLFGNLFGGHGGGGSVETGVLEWDGFARGGVPPVGKPFWVGENGPELMQVGSPSRVYSNNESNSMSQGGGMTLVFNQTVKANDAVSFKRSGRESARQGASYMLREMQRNGMK